MRHSYITLHSGTPQLSDRRTHSRPIRPSVQVGDPMQDAVDIRSGVVLVHLFSSGLQQAFATAPEFSLTSATEFPPGSSLFYNFLKVL